MRLLIDANILLDVLQNRNPHVEDSAKIWKLTISLLFSDVIVWGCENREISSLFSQPLFWSFSP